MDDVATKPLDIKLLLKRLRQSRNGGNYEERNLLCALLAAAFGLSRRVPRAGTAEPEKVTLTVKTPPIGLWEHPRVGEAEVYDMLTAAAERFQAQYDKVRRGIFHQPL